MKKLLIAAAITALTATAAQADVNVRIDPIFSVGGALTGGADFYINDGTALGFNVFSTSERAKLGIRFTKHWNLEESSNWLMVADANLIGYRTDNSYYDSDRSQFVEKVDEKLAGELRIMQQYRWQWSSGFNTTLGLGAFAVIDPVGEYRPWYDYNDYLLPVHGMAEWTAGWRF